MIEKNGGCPLISQGKIDDRKEWWLSPYSPYSLIPYSPYSFSQEKGWG